MPLVFPIELFHLFHVTAFYYMVEVSLIVEGRTVLYNCLHQLHMTLVDRCLICNHTTSP